MFPMVYLSGKNDTKNPAFFKRGFLYKYFLNCSGFLECFMRAHFADRSQSFCRDLHGDKFFEFRHIYFSFLNIRLASSFSGRVELRGARTV